MSNSNKCGRSRGMGPVLKYSGTMKPTLPAVRETGPASQPSRRAPLVSLGSPINRRGKKHHQSCVAFSKERREQLLLVSRSQTNPHGDPDKDIPRHGKERERQTSVSHEHTLTTRRDMPTKKETLTWSHRVSPGMSL